MQDNPFVVNHIKFLKLSKLDLSQEQVSSYLLMKQPQYSRYERGLRDIPTDVLIKLATLYNTSVDYLLGLTNNPKPYIKK